MRKLELWGGLVTAIYLILIGWWVSKNWCSFVGLDLNELGDFLAGTFGPVAFMWLVLGFLQQGRELKLSSEALQLQATELKKSVEQQTKLAAANEIALRNHENSLEPLFKISHISGGWDEENEFYAQFELRNLGEYCEEIELVVDLGALRIPPRQHEPMFSGDDNLIRVYGMSEWEEFTLIISYRSRGGRLGEQTFLITSSQDPNYYEQWSYYSEKRSFLRG